MSKVKDAEQAATGKRAVRLRFMLWAYRVFRSRKTPQEPREKATWGLLLEWASLGGKPDEVIGK